MKLVIQTNGRLNNWHDSLAPSRSRPRLPLVYSSYAAFISAGHCVACVHHPDHAIADGSIGEFSRIYRFADLGRAVRESDLAFLWAKSGIRAIWREAFARQPRSRVLLGSYVWRVGREAPLRARFLDAATRVSARRARAVVLMTAEQARAAQTDLGASVPVIRFTWGIDSAFYAPEREIASVGPEHVETIRAVTREPFVVLAGDQLRHDEDAFALAERYGVRLVRIPQEAATAERFRSVIRQRGLQDRLFVVEKASYPALHYLIQKAAAYVGLVDSTWQPAGWTVLCEALAAGTPALVYEGMTTREMAALGGKMHFQSVAYRDVGAVAARIGELVRRGPDGPARDSRKAFARDVLDVERTAACFVRDVERCAEEYGLVDLERRTG